MCIDIYGLLFTTVFNNCGSGLLSYCLLDGGYLCCSLFKEVMTYALLLLLLLLIILIILSFVGLLSLSLSLLTLLSVLSLLTLNSVIDDVGLRFY